jgi:hypothetical protein
MLCPTCGRYGLPTHMTLDDFASSSAVTQAQAWIAGENREGRVPIVDEIWRKRARTAAR